MSCKHKFFILGAVTALWVLAACGAPQSDTDTIAPEAAPAKEAIAALPDTGASATAPSPEGEAPPTETDGNVAEPVKEALVGGESSGVDSQAAANVVEATAKFGLEYPVAQDDDFATWWSYDNRYWPAEYLVDKNGVIRYRHFGEGAYAEAENQIRTLLQETEVGLSGVNCPGITLIAGRQALQATLRFGLGDKEAPAWVAWAMASPLLESSTMITRST